jgi:hypothetical protein
MNSNLHIQTLPLKRQNPGRELLTSRDSGEQEPLGVPLGVSGTWSTQVSDAREDTYKSPCGWRKHGFSFSPTFHVLHKSLSVVDS